MSKVSNKLFSNFPVKQLLHSRVVLYALCLLALIQVVMYGYVKDFNSIITLLMFGFLASFFSKNMIIVLGVAVFATYILNYVPARTISEGAENMDEQTPDKNKNEESAEKNPDEKMKEESAEKNPDEKLTEGLEEKVSGGAAVAEIANKQSASAEKATKESPADKKKMLYNSLQGDFKEFQKIQDSILKNMKEIDPLLAKAESFISKFENYSKIAENNE